MAWLESGAGWPLILLHAFPLRAEMWRPQLEAAPSGWRFIAPDLRGFGDGPPPDGDGSMDGYAADVCALMDALELDTSAIGGLSMGGYVAFAIHRQAPARCTRLILADTRAPADTPQGREGRIQMRGLLAEKGPTGVATQMLPKLLSPSAPPETVAVVRSMIESAHRAGVDAAIAALMSRPDSTPELARISCATLVTVGDGDALTPPADAEAMHRAITRSTLTVIRGAGHLSNLEQPATFSNALQDFLLSAL
jgi:pimeloyl-ACP methyl ester carboxylesterase